MKKFLLTLILVSECTFAAEIKCSEPNIKIFLKHYIQFMEVMADGFHQTGELVSMSMKNKWDQDKFETEYANVLILLKPKYKPHMDNLEAFYKAHPECKEKEIIASLTGKK